MLMRQKHWRARLLILKVSDIHNLIGSYIACPVGLGVVRRQSQIFLYGRRPA
jgi:hypothetical protein